MDISLGWKSKRNENEETIEANLLLSSSVVSLLGLVSLLVSLSLGLVWGLLVSGEGFPLLTEELTDTTEGDTWVVSTDNISVSVSEEHVSREGSLWSVWVCR